MPPLNDQDFITKLEREAAYQERLSEHQLLPSSFKGLGRVVIKKPWQSLLLISGVTTLLRRVTGLF